MTAPRLFSRRRFLRTAAGGVALASSVSLVSGCASLAPGKRLTRLVFYTDVHARTEWDTPVAMARAAAAINAQQPDFVVTGGDLITDGFQNAAATVAPRWDAYMTMHHAIRGDIYSTIGNHDLVAARPEDGSVPARDPRAIYLERLGMTRSRYSFDATGYRFFVLDTIRVSDDEYKYHGHVSREQTEWLKEQLARTPRNMPLVIVVHIPLLTSFYAATQGATVSAPPNRVVTNNIEVLQLFEKHQLILVLQGHLHIKERLQWRNTTFITGGAVCGRWWRGPWHGTAEGFSVITLDGNRVGWEYIDYGWQAKRPARL
jgi:3',5'-cyclic AMP phosphodiesterase CpdA